MLHTDEKDSLRDVPRAEGASSVALRERDFDPRCRPGRRRAFATNAILNRGAPRFGAASDAFDCSWDGDSGAICAGVTTCSSPPRRRLSRSAQTAAVSMKRRCLQTNHYQHAGNSK